MLSHVRTLKVLAAHVYGQAVTIVTNFVMPAVLVRSFGVDDFGFWVLVSAVSQFLIYSDFGFSSALSNYIATSPAFSSARAGNKKGKVGVLSVVFCIGVFSAMLFSAAVTYVVHLTNGFHGFLSSPNNEYVLLFVIVTNSLNPSHNIIIVIFRMHNNQSLGIICTNSLRLLESATI